MTESEWLGGDLSAQLRFAPVRLSARRQRLLAVAMCRAAEPKHPELLAALDVIERYADGTAPPVEIERARWRCRQLAQETYEAYRVAVDTGASAPASSLVDVAWAVAFAATNPVPLSSIAERLASGSDPEFGGVPLAERAPPSPAVWSDVAAPLRAAVLEVAGNPFREMPFDPAWRTDTALALARGTYERRDFGAMPILADALQDAGCDNEDLLAHCRDIRQVHARGCWVLDAVLGLA